MRNINVICLSGFVPKDAELKFTANGAPVLTFTVGYNVSKKVGDEWTDEAQYVDCVMFGNRAEALSKYLQKGKKVLISGALRQRKWKTTEGENRSKMNLEINELELVSMPDGKKSQEHREDSIQGPSAAAGGTSADYAARGSDLGFGKEQFDDDSWDSIPF